MTSSLSDAIDVLVMIAPQFIHAGPSELQLESVAWKLFAEGLPVARRQIVRREDLSALINLLLGLELQEGRGDICYRLGDAVQGTSEEEDSTKAFVDALAGEDNGQAIAFQQLFGAIELMVSKADMKVPKPGCILIFPARSLIAIPTAMGGLVLLLGRYYYDKATNC